jgi:hypothetical protein
MSTEITVFTYSRATYDGDVNKVRRCLALPVQMIQLASVMIRTLRVLGSRVSIIRLPDQDPENDAVT